MSLSVKYVKCIVTGMSTSCHAAQVTLADQSRISLVQEETNVGKISRRNNSQ